MFYHTQRRNLIPFVQFHRNYTLSNASPFFQFIRIHTENVTLRSKQEQLIVSMHNAHARNITGSLRQFVINTSPSAPLLLFVFANLCPLTNAILRYRQHITGIIANHIHCGYKIGVMQIQCYELLLSVS